MATGGSIGYVTGPDGCAPPPLAGPPVEAVVFDLDDTLFLQSGWLAGAWGAVAAAGAERYGLDAARLEEALASIAAEGSDRGRIIDRALERVGSVAEAKPLVDAFRSFRPASLSLLPGVAPMLADLRPLVRLGLVSDGDPGIQEAKLDLLGLTGMFDAVVLSDVLGRQFRKPDPTPLLRVLEELSVEPAAAVYIGDRPDKDVVAANRAGIRVIRVRTGEYSDRPSGTTAWAEACDAVSAARWLGPLLPSRRRG